MFYTHAELLMIPCGIYVLGSFVCYIGAAYGQGTYFARDASYSNTYASKGAGLSHMYLARVLTGDYTKGRSSMTVAPPKDATDPTVLFDSVVDDTANPTIYVVFYDANVYPEYLIVYKR